MVKTKQGVMTALSAFAVLAFWLCTSAFTYAAKPSAPTWTGWSEVPGNGATKSALATGVYQGKLYLFAHGTDDRIYMQTYSRSMGSQGTWSGWSEVPGNGSTYQPLAMTTYGNLLYLFADGTDNNIYMESYNGANSSWSGWSLVEGDGTTYVALNANTYGGQMAVLADGTDSKVYMNVYNGSSVTWTGWQQLAGNGTTTQPLGSAVYSRTFYVFADGTDNKIYVQTYNGRWSGWSEVPGNGATQSALAATSYGNTLYLFAHGTDDKIYLNELQSGQSSGQ